MSGIKPQESLQAQSAAIFKPSTIGNTFLGLWKGTWSGEDTVTYAQADGVFTKVGTEVTISNPTIVEEGSSVLISWGQEEFTEPGETANGYYVAVDFNGTKTIYVIERDPNVRDLDNPYRVTPRIREKYV